MPLKCYTRQRKDGSNYVSCDNKDLKTSEKKNISNNKMPPKKVIRSVGDDEIEITQTLIKKYPELSKLTSGKRLMIRGDKIKQIKSILKGKEDNDLYDRMVSLRTARKKREKGDAGKHLYTLARKGPSQSEPTIKPPLSTMKISKPKPKKKVVVKLDPSKIGAFTKLGKPVPKGKIKVYGVKKTTTKKSAPIQKVSTKAKAPRKSKPVKDAKTIPQKIAREELKGATKKNIVKPYLARNVRRGAGAVFV
jgi:hypothetical protein